jgi:hypothetical protein
MDAERVARLLKQKKPISCKAKVRSQPAPATAKIVFSVVNLNAVGLRQYSTPWLESDPKSSRFETQE